MPRKIESKEPSVSVDLVALAQQVADCRTLLICLAQHLGLQVDYADPDAGQDG